MQNVMLPLFLLVLAATGLSVGLVTAGLLIGPRREGAVKRMPYESGMNPIHDARRRFDVRFHLIAVAFLVFDVELLFLYPWAVSSKRTAAGEAAHGIDRAVELHLIDGRGIVFAEIMVFIALLAVGLVYAWRKGVFRWR
ncbi:MAG TPA: NADH-quinone oxidoreductase subunit A [Pirellulales bacterium]|jgi:NADH-quinone oxidoreductase subunit A